MIWDFWRTHLGGWASSLSESTADSTVRPVFGFSLACPSSDYKSPAVLRPLFLTKLFVLFADTKHFSLFLLSLTNYSLFVLQGRWWKKSVLATSSVVIILFLLSPIPYCKAIHQLFLVTEALPPWLCLQHSICLSMLCPLMCTLSLVYWIVWLLLLQTSGGRQNLAFTVELFAQR